MRLLLKTVFSPIFVASILRVTTPIVFPALGALIADLSGVVNIALEGIMLISAFTGVVISATTGSAWIGLVAAVLASITAGLFLGYFHLKLKANAILSGIALNLLAAKGTVFLLFAFTHNKGISTSLASKVLPEGQIPILKNVPLLGALLGKQNVLTYGALFAVMAIYLMVYKTPFGLRLRAVGENPEAARCCGISVHKVQLTAFAMSGALAGMGGVYLSMGYVSWFSRDMTAGRGFVALAAQVLGRRHPFGTLAASLLFGFADALSNYMQSLRIPGEFVQILPYVASLFALVLHSNKRWRRFPK